MYTTFIQGLHFRVIIRTWTRYQLLYLIHVIVFGMDNLELKKMQGGIYVCIILARRRHFLFTSLHADHCSRGANGYFGRWVIHNFLSFSEVIHCSREQYNQIIEQQLKGGELEWLKRLIIKLFCIVSISLYSSSLVVATYVSEYRKRYSGSACFKYDVRHVCQHLMFLNFYQVLNQAIVY